MSTEDQPDRMDVIVGANVRRFREADGLTQREIADRLGALGWQIDPTAMTRVENGTRSVRVSQLSALATALGVTVVELIDESATASLARSADTFAEMLTELRSIRTILEARPATATAPEPTPVGGLLNLDGISQATGVPVATLRDMRARGHGLRMFKLAGRVVATRDDVEAWIAEQREGGAR